MYIKPARTGPGLGPSPARAAGPGLGPAQGSPGPRLGPGQVLAGFMNMCIDPIWLYAHGINPLGFYVHRHLPSLSRKCYAHILSSNCFYPHTHTSTVGAAT
jgi:hypothetical protein